MKDSKGVDLVEGDLILITIDTPVHHPAELIIYISNEENIIVTDTNEDGIEDGRTTTITNTIKYYPLTPQGLEVAIFDNGGTQAAIHREQKFTVTNIEPRHVLKMDANKLSGYAKTLYDSISAEI